MSRPGYDPRTDQTRYGVCNKSDCQTMAESNKWVLDDIEEIESAQSSWAVLNYHCVFKGNCQFRKERIDYTAGDE